MEAVRLALGHEAGHLVIWDLFSEAFLEVVICIYLEINIQSF